MLLTWTLLLLCLSQAAAAPTQALEDTVARLERRVSELEAGQRAVGDSFTVARNAGFQCSPGTRVPFPTIVNNHGNGYDVATNQFVCPTNGIYQFSMTVIANERTWGMVSLRMDTQELASVWADSGDMQQKQGAGQTVVVQCLAGSTVYVQCSTDNINLLASASYNVATFSGVMLAAI